MPKDLDTTSSNLNDNNQRPPRLSEREAEEFEGRQCIYSFDIGVATIFVSFKALPPKHIRMAMVNAIGSNVAKSVDTKSA
jgi:hypothetical protein